MEKRVILAVVICAGIFVLWQQLFPPPKPAVTPPPVTSSSSSSASTSPGSAPPPAATGAPAAGTAALPPATAPAAVNHPEQEIELLTPAVRFVLSSAGGTLKHAQLLEGKYLLNKGDPTSG